MISKYSVSIIIPNYCGKTLLEKYLPSIFLALNSSKCIFGYELIVVDDFSTDNSIDFLQSEYKEIIVIKNVSNCGFSKTINKGIFQAKYEYVFLLNNDIFLPVDFFDKINLSVLYDTDFFGIYPTIYNCDKSKVLESRKVPSLAFGVIKYKDKLVQTNFAYSLYLSGGCALLNREKLLYINGFDTIYSPFYYEDLDLCIRAWKMKWKCYYTSKTYAFHLHSVTVNSLFSKEFVRIISVRNKLIVNYLHIDGVHRFSFWLNLCIKLFVAIIIRSTSKKLFILGFKEFEKIEKDLRSKRKLFKQKQVINYNAVIKNFF